MNLLVAGNTHGAPSDARRAVPATRGSSLSPEEACQSGRLQTWTARVTNSSTQRAFTFAGANMRIFRKPFYAWFRFRDRTGVTLFAYLSETKT
jgi:hypothetical protein